MLVLSYWERRARRRGCFLWALMGGGGCLSGALERFTREVSGVWVCYSVDGRKGARVVEG